MMVMVVDGPVLALLLRFPCLVLFCLASLGSVLVLFCSFAILLTIVISMSECSFLECHFTSLLCLSNDADSYVR